jgi:hypothetical protein
MISKIIISSLTLFQSAVNAQVSGTDCNAVRKFVFPDADDCDKLQSCADDYACVVTEDCTEYRCVLSGKCPKDTSFKAFAPHIAGNTGNSMEASELEGYYCAKDGLECGFNNDGYFFIEAIVNNVDRWNGLGTPDNRNVSMISKSKFEANEGGIFKQFSTSSCLGTPIEANKKLMFDKTTQDSDCVKEMDFSSRVSEHNGLLYIIDFYIGN